MAAADEVKASSSLNVTAHTCLCSEGEKYLCVEILIDVYIVYVKEQKSKRERKSMMMMMMTTASGSMTNVHIRNKCVKYRRKNLCQLFFLVSSRSHSSVRFSLIECTITNLLAVN